MSHCEQVEANSVKSVLSVHLPMASEGPAQLLRFGTGLSLTLVRMC